MIKNLSDDELLAKTKNLVTREREILIEVLNHLREIDRRKLFLERGFSSLWSYMTVELKYSEAAAQRRIEAMRAIRDVPGVEEKIASGVLSISNVAKAQSTVKRVEKTGAVVDRSAVFASLENKSQKNAEMILAAQFPEEVKVKESRRVVNAEVSELKMVVSNELIAKLEKVKNLMSHKNPNPSTAELLEMMADFVIGKKDLARPRAAQPPQRRFKKRKHISTALKREVWQDARGMCEYKDTKTGLRCESRHMLELEHLKPVAFGGLDIKENLRLFCREHNRLHAREATLG